MGRAVGSFCWYAVKFLWVWGFGDCCWVDVWLRFVGRGRAWGDYATAPGIGNRDNVCSSTDLSKFFPLHNLRRQSWPAKVPQLALTHLETSSPCIASSGSFGQSNMYKHESYLWWQSVKKSIPEFMSDIRYQKLTNNLSWQGLTEASKHLWLLQRTNKYALSEKNTSTTYATTKKDPSLGSVSLMSLITGLSQCSPTSWHLSRCSLRLWVEPSKPSFPRKPQHWFPMKWSNRYGWKIRYSISAVWVEFVPFRLVDFI